MRILIATQKKQTGLTYHRQTIPHNHLEVNYPGYQIDYTHDIENATTDQLKDFQIVSFLRIVNHEGKTEEIINKCKSAGCKVIVDIDDYWVLSPTHELKKTYEEGKVPEQTIEGLKGADWVTTTTEHFADKIREFNSNVTVLPNSIDPTERQFEINPVESERLRLGWIGGVYHSTDIRMLYEGFKDVWKSCNPNKFQLCLGGFTDNPAYHFLESVFTDVYKYPKDERYKNYLKQHIQLNNEEWDQPYKRLWGKDVFNYARLYNEIDVALVPLVETGFNSYKSQIKIIEAGWFKKAVVVSNVMPYTIDCNKSNSMLVSPSKRNEGWGVAMKSLILNPNKAEDLAEKLHEEVKEKYSMGVVNKVRNELYQRICE